MDRIGERLSGRIRGLPRSFRNLSAVSRDNRLVGPVLDYFWSDDPNNLGDACMRDAAQAAFQSVNLRKYEPKDSKRLQIASGLGSTREDAKGVVIGGGTLFSEYFAASIDEIISRKVPIASIGTGFGSSGFADSADNDGSAYAQAWRDRLRFFSEIGVRGRRSFERLSSAGVERISVVGDLAHSLTPRALPESKSDRIGFNITLDDGSESPEALGALREALRRLDKLGLGVQPFVVSKRDFQATERFIQSLRITTQPTVLAENSNKYFETVRHCQALAGVRLHSVILATCVGVRPVMLSYRQKGWDFMETVGWGEQCTDFQSLRDPDWIVEAATHSKWSREAVFEVACDWRETQRRHAARISAHLLGTDAAQ